MKNRKIIAVFAAVFIFSVAFFDTKTFDSCLTAHADYEFEFIDENTESASENYEYSYDSDIIEFNTIEAGNNSSNEEYGSAEIPVRSYNPVSAFVICLVIGLIAAFIAVSIMKSSMRSVHKKQGAADYRKENGFKLDVKTDNFLGKRVEKSPVMRAETPPSQKQNL